MSFSPRPIAPHSARSRQLTVLPQLAAPERRAPVRPVVVLAGRPAPHAPFVDQGRLVAPARLVHVAIGPLPTMPEHQDAPPPARQADHLSPSAGMAAAAASCSLVVRSVTLPSYPGRARGDRGTGASRARSRGGGPSARRRRPDRRRGTAPAPRPRWPAAAPPRRIPSPRAPRGGPASRT